MLNREGEDVMKWVESLFDSKIGPCRMPSMFPVKTNLFSKTVLESFSVGTSGQFAGVFSCGVSSNYSAYRISSLDTGTAYDGTLNYGAIHSTTSGTFSHRGGSNLTTDLTTYADVIRLSSYHVKIKYIGRLDAASGVIRTGFNVNNDNYGHDLVTPSQMMDLDRYMESGPLDQCEVHWTPHDISCFEFLSGSSGSNNIYIFGSGFPPGETVEITIIANYEYIPRVSYGELLGSTTTEAPIVESSKIGGVLSTISSAYKKFDGVSNIGTIAMHGVRELLKSYFPVVSNMTKPYIDY